MRKSMSISVWRLLCQQWPIFPKRNELEVKCFREISDILAYSSAHIALLIFRSESIELPQEKRTIKRHKIVIIHFNFVDGPLP